MKYNLFLVLGIVSLSAGDISRPIACSVAQDMLRQSVAEGAITCEQNVCYVGSKKA